MKMMSLTLSKSLISWLQTLPNRSELIREKLAAGLVQGFHGHPRVRNSARGTCAQTTVTVSEELYSDLRTRLGKGEISTFAETVLGFERDKALRAKLGV